MSSVYLIVLGFLLGYMAENQKKVRAERAVITRVLSSTRVEAGLTGTMQQILGEVMSIYGARRVLSASQEAHSYRVFLAEVNRGAEGSRGAALARGFAGKRKSVSVRLAGGRDLRGAPCQSGFRDGAAWIANGARSARCASTEISGCVGASGKI